MVVHACNPSSEEAEGRQTVQAILSYSGLHETVRVLRNTLSLGSLQPFLPTQGIVVHAYNPSNWAAETEGSLQVQS